MHMQLMQRHEKECLADVIKHRPLLVISSLTWNCFGVFRWPVHDSILIPLLTGCFLAGVASTPWDPCEADISGAREHGELVAEEFFDTIPDGDRSDLDADSLGACIAWCM